MSKPTLSQEVLRHANKVHALVSAAGDGVAVDRLEAEAARWSATSTDAVIAGDITRGKSSLINALVDRTGLLPVDADVATAVHLAVRFGRPEAVRVTRIDPETARTTTDEVDAARLVDLASTKGDEAARATVTAAEVLLDHPLLERGLTLVDTPGVGGMTRGHRDITMAALQRADVLVFVVSCVEPVSRSELEFLAEASERIGNVVLVATRADLGTAETNAEMLADLQRRIGLLAAEKEGAGEAAAAARLRRLAGQQPLLTSSYLAHQAARRAERGRAEQAAALRAQSGVDTVIDRLDRAVQTREDVRLTNLLQLIDAILAQLHDEQAGRLRALDGDSTVEDDLKARSEELEAAAGLQARWRSVLANGISKMQTSVNRDVSRELTVVRDHYRAMLDQHGKDLDLDAFGIQFQQSLQAAWSNLADHATRQFDGVITALLDELSLDGEPGLLGELMQPPSIAELAARPALDGDFDLLDDAIPLATQAFMFGNIANAMVGVLGIATGGLGLMAYGIGAAISAPVVLLRRKQRERRRQIGEVQRALNEALFGQEGISRELSTELTLRILDARQGLEEMIEQRLLARRKELEVQRRELQELLRAETATRAAGRQDAERRLAELDGLRAETTRLAGVVDARLTAALAAPRPTATTDADPADPAAPPADAPRAGPPAAAAAPDGAAAPA